MAGTNLRTFLTVAWNPESKLALTLQVGCFGVEAANDDHVAVELAVVCFSQALEIGQKLFCTCAGGIVSLGREELHHGI